MSLAVDAVFRPIRTGNAFEETVERLLHAIQLGVVTARARLPAERELALRLGVSRATLRDAIRELEQAGYVEARRGRSGGTFVIYQPTPGAGGVVPSLPPRGSGLEDALTLRSVLELGAAEAAARRDLGGDERPHLPATL